MILIPMQNKLEDYRRGNILPLLCIQSMNWDYERMEMYVYEMNLNGIVMAVQQFQTKQTIQERVGHGKPHKQTSKVCRKVK